MVSPTLIVEVLPPPCESTNLLPPPAPTWTVRVAPPCGGVGVGATGGVGVAPGGAGVAVAPGGAGVAVGFGPLMVLLSLLHDPAASTATATTTPTMRLRIIEHL